MQLLVSPLMPFPNMSWWHTALQCEGNIVMDSTEHFVKMSYRNRYYITGANGLIQLSIPLARGRDQRTPMHLVAIDNTERWQVNHWRTITSVYGRAPYFEHYAPLLEPLFTLTYEKLADFNLATVEWLSRHTRIALDIKDATEFQKEYGEGYTDLRNTCKPGIEKNPADTSLYYQLFSERNGFYRNLSLLDLLFSEGPAVKKVLQQHKTIIETWHK